VGQSNPNSVSLIPGLQRPLSRGWVRLGKPESVGETLLNPNYLAEEADVRRMVQMTKMSREIFGTQVFSKSTHRTRVYYRDLSTKPMQIYLVCRNRCDSYHHQVRLMQEWSGCYGCRGIPSCGLYGVEGLRELMPDYANNHHWKYPRTDHDDPPKKPADMIQERLWFGVITSFSLRIKPDGVKHEITGKEKLAY